MVPSILCAYERAQIFALRDRSGKRIVVSMTALPSSPLLAGVVLRAARPDDLAALHRLARLDSRRPLTGPLLVAEEDGTLRAALALESGAVVADPFAPTAHLVALLRRHAARRTAPLEARRGRRVQRGLTPALR
jgi:hypothetical protein